MLRRQQQTALHCQNKTSRGRPVCADTVDPTPPSAPGHPVLVSSTHSKAWKLISQKHKLSNVGHFFGLWQGHGSHYEQSLINVARIRMFKCFWLPPPPLLKGTLGGWCTFPFQLKSRLSHSESENVAVMQISQQVLSKDWEVPVWFGS